MRNMDQEEIIYTDVLLVGVDTGEEREFEHSMDELKSLAEAAYKRVVGIIIQKMDAVNKSLYIGTGKVKEVKEFAASCGAEEVIFDNVLSPSQVRNLGNELELVILDRTGLILDIFAIRARTKEAKLQVETAKLQYMLPRLVGLRDNLSRQGGTGGSMSNKGAGEKKLELDRRKIEHRISELKKELATVSKNRETMRKRRNNSGIPQVALVGYTNAGKSTIMNQMVSLYGEERDKTVLQKDMLFATLDTSVRSIHTGDNNPFFLVDTVGFIHKLPHDLVEAFHSTLEEVRFADLIVQVVDYSDEFYRSQMEVTEETLRELGAGEIPRITVFNKADKKGMDLLPKRRDSQLYMSAVGGVGIDELAGMIKAIVYADKVNICLKFPFQRGDLVSYFRENATVSSQEYCEDGVRMNVRCRKADADKYAEFRED